MLVRTQTGWVLGLLLLASFAWGQPPSGATAHDVVRDASERVMAVVAEAEDYADKDPERYYTEIQGILDPVIDFRGFARGVMGPYGSSERYRSLDEAGRAQLRGQLDRFAEVMRQGLVRTYGKGLLAFGGSRIEVSEAAPGEAEMSRVSVKQLVFSPGAEPYVLMYQMGRDKDKRWKLRNIIIESVNLGEIYRSQFEAAARKHDGDLNAVIDGWEAVEVDT
jgi:phospholipid transport system substrate-binding protein